MASWSDEPAADYHAENPDQRSRAAIQMARSLQSRVFVAFGMVPGQSDEQVAVAFLQIGVTLAWLRTMWDQRVSITRTLELGGKLQDMDAVALLEYVRELRRTDASSMLRYVDEMRLKEANSLLDYLKATKAKDAGWRKTLISAALSTATVILGAALTLLTQLLTHSTGK